MITDLRFRVLASVVLLVLGCSLPACDKRAEDRAAVRQAWTSYSEGFNSQDGKKVADAVSKSTIDYYTRILKTALDGKRAEVAALPPVEQLEIITIRNRATRKQVQGYTGKGYLIYAVSHGWFVESELSDLSVSSINFNGDSATAKLTFKREVLARQLRFVKEDGVWKFDETSLNPVISDQMEKDAKMLRMSVTKYIEESERDSNGELKSTVWEPMK